MTSGNLAVGQARTDENLHTLESSDSGAIELTSSHGKWTALKLGSYSSQSHLTLWLPA